MCDFRRGFVDEWARFHNGGAETEVSVVEASNCAIAFQFAEPLHRKNEVDIGFRSIFIVTVWLCSSGETLRIKGVRDFTIGAIATLRGAIKRRLPLKVYPGTADQRDATLFERQAQLRVRRCLIPPKAIKAYKEIIWKNQFVERCDGFSSLFVTYRDLAVRENRGIGAANRIPYPNKCVKDKREFALRTAFRWFTIMRVFHKSLNVAGDTNGSRAGALELQRGPTIAGDRPPRYEKDGIRSLQVL